MKPRCVVLDGFTLTEQGLGEVVVAGEPTWNRLAEHTELCVYPRTPADLTVKRAANAELVLTNKVRLLERELEALPRLRYIGVLATGTNVVDLDAARARDIVVTNVPDYATESVVEHVFGLLFELSLAIGEHAQAVSKGTWSSSPDFSFRVRQTNELAGKTLGIVGFGTIGRRVATVASAFGMRVIVAHSHRGNDVSSSDLDVTFCTLDELFAEADVITLHCPLVAETYQIVNRARLAKMKRDAFLINTGRGPLIDEEALATALHEGQLGGAGLDVLSEEPPRADHPLIGAPRCLITPHVAWATRTARMRLMGIVVDNVEAYLRGAPIHRVLS
jgi:glycerate dehydrogenase